MPGGPDGRVMFFYRSVSLAHQRPTCGPIGASNLLGPLELRAVDLGLTFRPKVNREARSNGVPVVAAPPKARGGLPA
jgi:hypothetical protein